MARFNKLSRLRTIATIFPLVTFFASFSLIEARDLTDSLVCLGKCPGKSTDRCGGDNAHVEVVPIRAACSVRAIFA